MSLHSLAHHLQEAGRGEDKVLVHMTPKEVGGLQALAKAHGGSLTINPHTGLPEAGFLSSLLPMAIGFGLAPFTGGLSAALMVGAGYTAATGSLKKGLMAGLGAYGGAGLMEGLTAAGTSAANASSAAANTPAMNVANTGVEGMKANLYGPGQGVFSTAPSAVASTAAQPAALANAALPNTVTGGALTPAVSAANQNAALYQPGGALYTPDPGAMNVANRAFQPSVAAVRPESVVPEVYSPQSAYTVADSVPAAQVTAPRSFSTDATVANQSAAPSTWDKVKLGAEKSFTSAEGVKGLYNSMPTGSAAALGNAVMSGMQPEPQTQKVGKGMIRPYEYSREVNPGVFDTGAPMWASTPGSSAEKNYFTETMTPLTPYQAPGPEYKAKSGLASFAVGGPIEQMSAQNAVGDNSMYPQAGLQTAMYSNPMIQRPMPTNVIQSGVDMKVDPYTGEQKFAGGGIANLGDYSDGGRLLKGPGDGVSDSIPADIAGKQPARLANNEFVIPARIVSEIGNGSTDAGAKRLYAMMDRVQQRRAKTVGKGKVAVDSGAHKELNRL